MYTGKHNKIGNGTALQWKNADVSATRPNELKITVNAT